MFEFHDQLHRCCLLAHQLSTHHHSALVHGFNSSFLLTWDLLVANQTLYGISASIPIDKKYKAETKVTAVQKQDQYKSST